METVHEIIICHKCKGGKLLECRSPYDYIGQPCKNCDGSGRLYKITSIDYKPFK